MNSDKKNILVVDDQPNNLNLVTSILKPFYNVFLANDGEKAVVVAQEKKTDLILLDIMMPGLSGFEVCSILKANDKTKDIPVIFLTALSEGESIEKAYEVGGIDYIIKPINTKELLARIKTHLTIKENEFQLNALNRELQLNDLHKNKIFSIISHDLTNSISGSRQLLEIVVGKFENKSITLEILEPRVRAIYKEISNANNILQDLLWWSRSQLKKIQFNPVAINLEELIQKVTFQLERQLTSKNISLSVNIDKGIAAFSDPEMLIIVLRNLIGNAIKFSHPNGIIEVESKPQGNEILLSVADHGVGITEENKNHIFSPGPNISTLGTKGEKGTGLGLHLCMDLIGKCGGKMWFESEEGKGSTFFFTCAQNV